MPAGKAWAFLIGLAASLKAARPAFQGRPPRLLGLRALARARGFPNHAAYVRHMKEQPK